MEKNFELTREFIDLLKDIIESKNIPEANKILNDLHSADIAEIYEELNIEEAKFLFLLLDNEKAGDVLIELEEHDREKLLDALPPEVIAKQFINEMNSDDAADIIGDLSEEKQEEVLSLIEDLEQASDIVDLLNYHEDSAGGIMAKEYIAVKTDWDIKTCIQEIRIQAEDVDDIYFVYVVDKDNLLQGIVSLKDLLLGNQDQKIINITKTDIIYVKTDESAEEVANLMGKYDLVALPVVDSIKRLVGRITIDDVVDVIREEAERDYQLMSGITGDIESSDKIFHITKARLPWLLIGLMGGILAALVISKYEDDLKIFPEMAFFIPLVGAMGGNAGIQSSSIIVQGLANNSLGIESTRQKLIKEFSIGLTNGLICSAVLFGINLMISDYFSLTVSVSLSLLIVIIFASLLGTFIPLMLNKLKIDPALATGPFITTLNDILGLTIYFLIGRFLYVIL